MFRKFWERIEKTDSCWLWLGYRTERGYGIVKAFGVAERAHRVSYALTYGAIPDGLDVCHRCDNPPCVRPDHLFLGTEADNEHDKWAKDRGRLPENRARGEQHGSARLTLPQVEEIKRRHRSGAVSQRALGKEYGISHRQIGRIIRGDHWKETA